MLYRKFGKYDFEISGLGFGLMRLPVLNGDMGKIDEEKTIEMVRYAIDKGVNYLDTAYVYHNKKSEEILSKILKDGYREKTRIATKLPSWLVKNSQDFDKLLEEQLKRIETDCIDMYLIHSLNKRLWEKLKGLGIMSFMDDALKKGKIKHIGFSFHDELPVFKNIICEYDWHFCQIQLNYLDADFQAGVNGLMYAASKGLPVIVMEPLKGGALAMEPAKAVLNIWEDSGSKMSPIEWAFKWVYNFPEVVTVLSGMGDLGQVKQNIEIASRSPAGCLNDKELDALNQAVTDIKNSMKIPCTSCGYCLPCPSKVNIPQIFRAYNYAAMHNDYETKLDGYFKLGNTERADACTSCEACIKKCPQKLAISDYMAMIAEETVQYEGKHDS